MKQSLFFSLLSLLALSFASCTKAPPRDLVFDASPTINPSLAPAWVQNADSHVYIVPAAYLITNDFVRVETPEQLRTLTDQVMAGLGSVGRTIPRDICEQFCRQDYKSEKLQLVRDAYFYPNEDERGRTAYVRTRTVKNGVEHQYCNPPVLFELVAHLGAPLPNGYANALNYYPYGSSAGTISFADIQMACVAMNNPVALQMLPFDPDVAYPNTYPNTDDPIVFSPLTYEMIYPSTVNFDSGGPSGPFGTNGTTNYVYVNTTPANEVFVADSELPNWPLNDAVWHFPIPGLGPCYVLKL